MDDIIKELNRPSWWIGVVFFGLLVSVSANYVKEWLDKVISKYSEKRKLKLENKQAELEKEAETFLSNPMSILELKLDRNYRLSWLSIWLLFAISPIILFSQPATGIFSEIIRPIFASFFFVYALTTGFYPSLQKLKYVNNLIYEVKKKKEALANPITP